MMPQDGYYQRTTITREEFKFEFLKYKDNFKSFVGYPNACRVVFEITGHKIPINRDITEIKGGDVILVLKLRYRVSPSEKKGNRHGDNVEDYEFCRISYSL